ncbi:OmpA family protein [Qipengyuania gaetbuli]|uniref:OmpA family protein n=1 Tax=Qipengyuania gaetbuli TaxID=266952 RepID=UPI001CFD2C98|nr:OmpA family protein [Qipengyuania gaetbuli]
MTRQPRTWIPTIALAVAVAGLSACGSGDAPDPETTPTDGPRSIFDKEGAGPKGSDAPEAVLPPLVTTLGFPDGTAELTEAALAELATVLDSPQMDQGGRIVLRGHSDSGGTDAANLAASLKRAEAVQAFLVENGVAESRIKVIAFGEQNPMEPNALPDGQPNEVGRAANRRVEITIETTRLEQEDAREPTLIETITKEQEEARAQSEVAGE